MFSRSAIYALFYLSGIAGLIYQVLWLRRLSLIFGVTVYAASTVLAAFMAGLAIGSALSGRVMRRGIAPLAAFGFAEILIGITGLLSPVLLDAASALYVALHAAAPDSLGVLTIARLACSFAILAIPTTMMGITLPLLTEAVSQRTGSAGTSVSLLYAMNTLGAMSGTLLTGYILIPAIGIRQSFLLAAAPSDLEKAKALYAEAEFASVVATLERMLQKPQSKADVAQAKIYLGMSHLVLGNESKAKSAFREVLTDDPQAQLPPQTSPKVLAQNVINVFGTLNAAPPGVLATLSLLMLHAASFLGALVLAVVISVLKDQAA